ncbi:T9SS C-terminal target domain-containing protein [Rubrivirga marina]|uniref:Secretion system C-terminal sorting domain-containing protein n=1 Tax=Rubrivirga marina TaxID=1196024 RepID=A0A271J1X9_9BACT|nr:T9SS C-terminal target domain-containing protein [Rubrivirga marina]PAP76709.1 hypothetical protein BSZ37_09785 [Rubrivirga marina]
MRTLFAPVLLLALVATASAQTWDEGPPMPTARAGATGVVLDGRIVVIGGQTTTGEALSTVEAFDPDEGWTTLSPLRVARSFAASAVLGGRIVVVGGRGPEGEPLSSVEAYDPAANEWMALPDLPAPREGLGAAVLDGTLYVTGGTGADGVLFASAEKFGDTWSALTPPWTLDPPRAGFGMVARGGFLVTAGGFSAVGPLRRATEFDPETGLMRALDPLPFPRGGVAATTDGETIWVVGGRDDNDVVTANVYELIAGIDRVWEPQPQLPQPVEAAVAAVLGDSLYVLGGADAFGGALDAVRVLSLFPVNVPTEDGPASSPAIAVVGPNPSRAGTTLELRLGRPGSARVTVFDVLGREVAVLHDGDLGGGPTRVAWGARVPAGVYVVRLDGPDGTVSVPLTVAR